MHHIARRAAMVLVLLVLPFSFAGPSQANSTEMSVHRAGQYYLNTICPANHAYSRFVRIVWHGEHRITTREVKRRLPAIRKASRALSAANFKADKRLFNPPAPWPSIVKRPIANMINAFDRWTQWSARMGSASSAHSWLVNNGRYNRVSDHNAPTIIRSRLDLPAPGKGC